MLAAVYHDRIRVFPLLWTTPHRTTKLAQVRGHEEDRGKQEKGTIRADLGHSNQDKS